MWGGQSSNKSNKRLGFVLVCTIVLLVIALFVDRIKVSLSGFVPDKELFIHGFRSYSFKNKYGKQRYAWGSGKGDPNFKQPFSEGMRSRGIAWMIFAVASGIVTAIAILIGCIMENYRCSQKALAGLLLLASVSLAVACLCMVNIEYPYFTNRRIEEHIEWGSTWIMACVDVGILFLCSLVVYVRHLEAWD